MFICLGIAYRVNCEKDFFYHSGRRFERIDDYRFAERIYSKAYRKKPHHKKKLRTTEQQNRDLWKQSRKKHGYNYLRYGKRRFADHKQERARAKQALHTLNYEDAMRYGDKYLKYCW